MIIKRLVLHKCERIPFIDGETLTITPTRKLQVILGTNGSGKSSLMDVGFNLWPSNASDFEKGGYRELDVLVGQTLYRLRDDYSGKSPTYAFDIVSDGHVTHLNAGGTRTEQVNLITEQFGLDQHIRNVLLGKEEFTSMTPARRRYWVTRLSLTDFTFALDFFTRTQRMHRSKLSVLKHQRERIVQEQSKVFNKDDLGRIHNRLTELNQLLDAMYANKVSRPDNTKDDLYYFREIASVNIKLSNAITEARQYVPQVPPTVFNAVTKGVSVRAHLDALDGIAAALDGQCQAIGKQYNDLAGKVGSVRENQTIDTESLRVHIESLESRIAELCTGLKYEHLDHLNLTQAMYTLNQFSQLTQHHINAYMDERNGVLTKQQQELDASLRDLARKESETRIRYNEVEHVYKHITQANRTECPECSHVFIPNSSLSEADLPGILAELDDLQGTLNSITKRQQDLEQSLAHISEIKQTARDVHNVLSPNTELYPYWDALLDDPTSVFVHVNKLKHDIRVTMERLPIEKELAECKDHYVKVLADQDPSGRELVAYFDELSSTYAQTQAERNAIQAERDLVSSYKDAVLRKNQILQNVHGLVEQLHQTYDNLVYTVYADEQSRAISQMVSESKQLEQSISSNNSHQYTIDSLDKDIANLSHTESTLKLMIDTLSPKDGLLAERMTDDIGTLVMRLNRMIESVWGYKMYVKPCINRTGNIDYKFPLVVDTPKGIRERSDVADGSSAQISIINQAFRFLVYKRLGLEGHPLYLDELGANFDEVHRKNLIDILGDVFEDPTYGQVFLISHYVETAMGSTLGEFIVTDARNITVPDTYNEHVVVS